jgi:RNA polymerase sigma factor (sigma-70 family)
MTGQPATVLFQIPDEEIIARILKGEHRLFEVIMRRYNQRLYRIGMSVLNSDTEVEDAMQTAYISAYEHLSGFGHRSSFITWLTRIMLNQCYAQKRKNNLSKTISEQTDNLISMKTPANVLVNKELNNVLERAIAQLPEKYRLVFVLREIEEMSVRDTSEALSIGETNVKVRLNRAKTMLREGLSHYIKDHVYSFHLNRCDRLVHHVLHHLNIG